MLKTQPEWKCASILIKESKLSKLNTVIYRIDTREAHGIVSEHHQDFPFLGEDVCLNKMTEFFNNIRGSHWQWYANQMCKYVRLYVDFNKHTCKIQNRDGVNITFDQLKYQYNGKRCTGLRR